MRGLDVLGKRFGRLTVMRRVGSTPRSVVYECQCDCGGVVQRRARYLTKAQHELSCGCVRIKNRVRKTSGITGRSRDPVLRPIWQAWYRMHMRCRDEREADYPRYGGRGITVCDRWATFENFYADMGPRPTGYLLDRIDNDKGYYPENCRWATPAESTLNRSATVLMTHGGKTMHISAWVRELGICRHAVMRMYRQKTGVVEEAKRK